MAEGLPFMVEASDLQSLFIPKWSKEATKWFWITEAYASLSSGWW
jgi:hypothetical protein